jgi:hypothetical protein
MSTPDADITRILRCTSCQSPLHCRLDESDQVLVLDVAPAIARATLVRFHEVVVGHAEHLGDETA